MIDLNIDILPNESFYSYLCRLYAHSGLIYDIEFKREVFSRPEEYNDYDFINYLKKDFKDKIESRYGFKNIILNHTLFSFYVRFLPEEEKKKALKKAIDNTQGLRPYLPLPRVRSINYLSDNFMIQVNHL